MPTQDPVVMFRPPCFPKRSSMRCRTIIYTCSATRKVTQAQIVWTTSRLSLVNTSDREFLDHKNSSDIPCPHFLNLLESSPEPSPGSDTHSSPSSPCTNALHPSSPSENLPSPTLSTDYTASVAQPQNLPPNVFPLHVAMMLMP